MPESALALALASAFVHAGWNLLIARARDPQAATAVGLATSAIVFAPLAAATWRVDSAAWPYIAVSATLHLTYFGLLAAAYVRAELSVVYPIARGVAPVGVLGAGVILLGAATSPLQVAGVLLVGAGVLAIRGFGRGGTGSGVAFGLLIAGCIAAYTLVDKRGVEHAAAMTYLELTLIAAALAYSAVFAMCRGPAAIRRELNPAAVLAGLGGFGAYLLVLLALQRAAAASVAAVRETSVVIAAALAGPVLGERVGRWRLGGAVLVLAGVALLAVD